MAASFLGSIEIMFSMTVFFILVLPSLLKLLPFKSGISMRADSSEFRSLDVPSINTAICVTPSRCKALALCLPSWPVILLCVVSPVCLFLALRRGCSNCKKGTVPYWPNPSLSSGSFEGIGLLFHFKLSLSVEPYQNILCDFVFNSSLVKLGSAFAISFLSLSSSDSNR